MGVVHMDSDGIWLAPRLQFNKTTVEALRDAYEAGRHDGARESFDDFLGQLLRESLGVS